MQKFKQPHSLLLLVAMFFICSPTIDNVLAIDPHCIRANKIFSTEDDYTYAVASNSKGESVVAGMFSGTMWIGFNPPRPYVSKGENDIFITKYNASGAMQWRKIIGSSENEQAMSVDMDEEGHVVVTGAFRSTLKFGWHTLTSQGGSDAFTVFYESDGTVRWAQQGMCLNTLSGHGVAIDKDQNVYVTGSFYNKWCSFGTTTLTNAGLWDAFIVKYDKDGNVIRARSAGGPEADTGEDITVDSNGNIYFTGKFQGSIQFSRPIGSPITLTSRGKSDIYLAKYGTVGTAIWAKQAGSWDEDWGPSVALDKMGNPILTGIFNSSLKLESFTWLGWGMNDSFIAKFDYHGNVQWGHAFGGTGNESAHDIAVDDMGNSYVTGHFNSRLQVGEMNLEPTDGYDIFLAAFNDTGTPIWARSAAGQGDESCHGVAVDDGGNCYIAGAFQQDIQLDDHSLKNNGNDRDVFVAKICDPILGNMIANGDFYDDMENWLLYLTNPASASPIVHDGVFQADIPNGGTGIDFVRLIQGGLQFESGKNYRIAFDAWADAPRQISVWMRHHGDPFTTYAESGNFSLSTTKQRYSFSFLMRQPSDNDGRVQFNLGSSDVNIYMDNISLTEDDENLLVNENFAYGELGWASYLNEAASAEMSVQDGRFVANIQNGGTESWHVQLLQPALFIGTGSEYIVNFVAWADAERSILVSITKSTSPYTNYSGGNNFSLTTDQQNFSYRYEMSYPTDPGARLVFDLGLSEHNVYIDSIKVKIATHVEEELSLLPTRCALFPNYPNPFNPSTTLKFSLAQTSRVRMDIYNTSGQLIETVIDAIKPSGIHQVLWDAHYHPSGAYFCRLTATPNGDGDTVAQTRKLLLLK